MRLRWPPAEPAHHDYETLREAALAGQVLGDEREARFETRGMAGLIARPVSETLFHALWVGSPRPPWTPYGDPRTERLIRAFGILLDAPHLNADSSLEEF